MISQPQFAARPAIADSAFVRFLYLTYAWMASGLAVSGLTAYVVASTPSIERLIHGNSLVLMGLFVAQMGLVITIGRKVATLSAPAAGGLFLAYSWLNGIVLSSIFMAYTQASLTQAFVISGGAFAGLSLFGAVTKRDLSPVGHFMMFGLIGILLASVVNMFMHSSAIHFICSCAGVLVFAGLTAYDNQRLKYMFSVTGGAGNLAIHGALTLYLDFINMFLFVLQLFGDRRR
jgi:FtsH-binding integral membrane protein